MIVKTIRRAVANHRQNGLHLDEIQGDILRGYGLAVSAHIFVRLPSAESGRTALTEVLSDVTSAQRWESRPTTTLNLAITFAGLAALDAPPHVLASFPEAFREGMAGRASRLGDTGRSAPEHWDAGLGTGDAHLLFTVGAVGQSELDAEVDELMQLFARLGIDVVSDQRAKRLPERKEHFGYLDGVGQPAIEGTGDAVRGQGDLTIFNTWRGMSVGEIIHGHVGSGGDLTPGPVEPFGRHGTYKVWRKLYEDAAQFRSWTAEQAELLEMSEELLRAKLIGRWPDGSPLALTPERPDPDMVEDRDRVNAFDYSNDPNGERCPFGSHIRRANPRAGLGFGDSLSERQRIIRRGVTYGPALAPGAPDDGVDRGIFFVAYMADIERQFEFIQAEWFNDGDMVNVGHDRDPIMGQSPGDHKFVIPGAVPKYVHPLPEIVITRGGEYLWTPSMDALGHLADGAWEHDEQPHGGDVQPDNSSDGSSEFGAEAVGPAGRFLGIVLAPLATTIAFVRGRRVVHPIGRAYRAEVVVADPTAPLLAGTVLGESGSHSGTVRLSRGYGRKLSRRDVHGLALRIDADESNELQDVLLATVRRGQFGRDATAFTPSYFHVYSTMLKLRSPAGRFVLKAIPRHALPDDADVHAGKAEGATFDLAVGPSARNFHTAAVITLGAALSLEETEALAFNPANSGGGLRPSGLLNAARTIVYTASQRGRSARSRRPG